MADAPPEKVRLQKLIASRGIASRREVEQMIVAGRIKVNGKKITTLGSSADPQSDEIVVDGKLLPAERSKRVILLHKPVGYLSSCKPSREVGVSLLDLLPEDRRYFPIGRLDRDTSGMIIVTDDGDLALKLSHPRYGSQKTYLITTVNSLSSWQISDLREGVMLDDGPAAALHIKQLSLRRIIMVLGEGRNRQVRRMIKAVGATVARLERTAIGALSLKSLKPGQWRYLDESEILALKSPSNFRSHRTT